MKIGIITLFPQMFKALQYGMPRRAQEREKLKILLWDPRNYTEDTHRTVDDTPYGGGPGMLMTIEPLEEAIRAARQALPSAKVVYLSPQGRVFNQAASQQMASVNELILICGRYEGIDERLITLAVDEEWSIGDYVLSGGELAAMVMIDAISRLIPGVLGDSQSAEQDSFSRGLLDHPHYTRPPKYKNLSVPGVLLTGDHARIRDWRLQQALGRTWLRRPDLLEKIELNETEQALLEQFKKENVDSTKTN